MSAATINNLFKNFHNVDSFVKDHLTRVYSTLTAASVCAALGAYINIYTNLIPYAAGIISSIASLILLLSIYATEHNQKNTPKRLGFLMGFAFCAGLGLGPLIDYTMWLNPSIVVTALTGSIFVFVSFTLSALLAKPGSYLSLIGLLAPIMTTMLGLSLANIFFQSVMIYRFNLYVGLAIMSAFVLYDTSAIMTKRQMGDTDFIIHSLDLFIDFIGLFRRLLVILSDNERERRRRERN